MRPLFQHFSRAHLRLFVGFYIVFGAVTFFILNSGTVSDRRENAIAVATVGVVSGPFTGAIARNCKSCCLAFSRSILPWCASFLGVGLLFPIVPLPFQRFARATRLSVWCVGLLGWFGGALVSFLHALS